jgi:hypothetical protein
MKYNKNNAPNLKVFVLQSNFLTALSKAYPTEPKLEHVKLIGIDPRFVTMELHPRKIVTG